MDYPENEESPLNEISAYFNRSGKRTAALKELAAKFCLGQTKIVKSGKTRWLSRAGCVAVVVKLYYVLVQTFLEDKDNEVAAALLRSTTTFMVVAVFAAMADFLPMLATLSESFQADVIDYSADQSRLFQVRSQITEDFLQFKGGSGQLAADATSAEWDAVWNKQLESDSSLFEPPTSETAFELHSNPEQFRSVKLSGGTPEVQEQALKWTHKFALAIMSRLDDRFPAKDMAVLKALEILNPEKMPECSSDLKGYGDQPIQDIIDHYGVRKVSDSGQVSAAMIDGEALRVQWKMFKHVLHKYKVSETKAADAFADLLPPRAAHGQLPSEIEKLVCIRLVMMYNTGCCERGFSRMGLIKTYLRNRMYVETVDALMAIGLVGQDFVDLADHSDPVLKAALEVWEKECLRNPNQARFGNQSATKERRKKRVQESRTELPLLLPEGAESDRSGLDDLADQDEQIEEESDSDGGEDAVPNQANTPFNLPNYEVQATSSLSEINEKELAGQKIAYYFEDGWDVGVFKKKYKGRSQAFQGTYQVYFQSFKKNYFPRLELEAYGATSTWCIVKTNNRAKRK